jgi:hypothetical protein
MILIQAAYSQRHFWIRLGRWGIVMKDAKWWPLLFSQRQRGHRGFTLGRLYVGLLPKLKND